ncbi:MAG: AAA family ATPase [Gammaproteobacteria bacterium]|nr:AAA family ATPase [Gammaproteobacteria bacterium]
MKNINNPLTLMLVPIDRKIDLTQVSLALVKALQDAGKKVGYFRPIAENCHDFSYKNLSGFEHLVDVISLVEVERLLAAGLFDDLLESVLTYYDQLQNSSDIIVVQGLGYLSPHPFAPRINLEIATALNAKLIATGEVDSGSYVLDDVLKFINSFCRRYYKKRIYGAILVKRQIFLESIIL